MDSVALRIEQHPGRLSDLFLDVPQPTCERIENRQVGCLGCGEKDRGGILRHLHRDDARQAVHFERPACQASVARQVVHPYFRAAILMRAFTTFVHRHVQTPELAVDSAQLIPARPPVRSRAR